MVAAHSQSHRHAPAQNDWHVFTWWYQIWLATLFQGSLLQFHFSSGGNWNGRGFGGIRREKENGGIWRRKKRGICEEAEWLTISSAAGHVYHDGDGSQVCSFIHPLFFMLWSWRSWIASRCLLTNVFVNMRVSWCHLAITRIDNKQLETPRCNLLCDFTLSYIKPGLA